MKRRVFLKRVSSFLAFCLSPLAGLFPPRTSRATLEGMCRPATYQNLDGWREECVDGFNPGAIAIGLKEGEMLSRGQILYSGRHKVVFDDKNFGTIAIKSPVNRSLHVKPKKVS